MKQIKIIMLKLFDSLMEFSSEDKFYDLHNDFDCKRIRFSKHELSLEFIFSGITNSNFVRLKFCNVEIEQFNFNFLNDNENIIDNLYRGKYQIDKTLHDNIAGKGYIYAEFLNGMTLEFLAEEMITFVE